MFDKMKQFMQLKSKMNEAKRRLDGMEIKVQSPKKNIEITVSGSQEIKEIVFLTDFKTLSQEELSKEIKEVTNKAIKESQAMAAKTMSSMVGLGDLGGLGGFGA